MAVEIDSVWLKAARKPVRRIMLLSAIATGCLVSWLIFDHAFLDGAFDMKMVLAPASYPVVLTAMIFAAMTVFFTCVYWSDSRGAIEIEPSGFFDIVSLVFARLSMMGTAAIVLVMLFEVVSRYVFASATLWANELSLWIAGFVFLLAGLYAMQQRSHIRIYVIYDLFPRWARKLADAVSVVLTLVFTALLIWGGYNEALSKFIRWETFGTAWDPPLPATIKPAILIVISLMAIQAVSNLIADWNKEVEHHGPAEEIEESEIEIIRKTIGD